MANAGTIPAMMSQTMQTRSASLLSCTSMTPIERMAGRFLRAPDHDPAGDPPAADPGAGDQPAGDGLDDSTILGGGDKATGEDGGDKSGEGKPADAPKEEGEQQEDAPQGAPETYELELPDGMVLDEAAFALAEPVFRELNLSNEQASKLAGLYPQLAQAGQTAASQAIIGEVVAQRKAWATETQNDPTYGGANFEASKVNAARFIDQFGTSETDKDGKSVNVLRRVMDETGLGNHPALFAAFAKAGAELAEDVPNDPTPPANAPKTLGEKYYGASGQ